MVASRAGSRRRTSTRSSRRSFPPLESVGGFSPKNVFIRLAPMDARAQGPHGDFRAQRAAGRRLQRAVDKGRVGGFGGGEDGVGAPVFRPGHWEGSEGFFVPL